MAVVACGYLNDDGTRCNNPATAFVMVLVNQVPVCDLHREADVTVQEIEQEPE